MQEKIESASIKKKKDRINYYKWESAVDSQVENEAS